MISVGWKKHHISQSVKFNCPEILKMLKEVVIFLFLFSFFVFVFVFCFFLWGSGGKVIFFSDVNCLTT